MSKRLEDDIAQEQYLKEWIKMHDIRIEKLKVKLVITGILLFIIYLMVS